MTLISNNIAKDATENLTVLNKVQNDISELRELENEFHLEPKNEQKNLFSAKRAEIKADSETLIGNIDFTERMMAIDDRLNKAMDSFNAIYALQEEIGFSFEAGMLGQVRNTAHEVEVIVEGFDTKRLLVEVLLLRRHEKDFFIRSDLKYMEQFKTEWKTLNELLTTVSLSSEIKEELSGKLTAYHDAFTNLVSNMEKLGLNSQSGIKKEFNDRMLDLDAEFNKVVMMISKNAQSAIRRSNFISIGGLVIWI